MGRIGAGEAMTVLFGVGGPLVHLTIGAALLMAGHRAVRAGRPFGTAAFSTAGAALVAVALGLLAATAGVAGALSGAGAEGGSEIARGVGDAMGLVALGVAASGGLYLVSGALLLLAWRRR